jgi:hypothetical protein
LADEQRIGWPNWQRPTWEGMKVICPAIADEVALIEKVERNRATDAELAQLWV